MRTRYYSCHVIIAFPVLLLVEPNPNPLRHALLRSPSSLQLRYQLQIQTVTVRYIYPLELQSTLELLLDLQFGFSTVCVHFTSTLLRFLLHSVAPYPLILAEQARGEEALLEYAIKLGDIKEGDKHIYVKADLEDSIAIPIPIHK